MMSGMRNPPPISTSSPRETTTSLPRASVSSASSTAAAQLLTTSAASAPVRRRSRPLDMRVARAALLPRRRPSRGWNTPRRRATSRSRASGDRSARPRLVCSTTPVALMTGASEKAPPRASRPATRSASASIASGGSAGLEHAPPLGRQHLPHGLGQAPARDVAKRRHALERDEQRVDRGQRAEQRPARRGPALSTPRRQARPPRAP